MSDEKKIIIDEDWKTQVEAEKVAAEAARTAPAGTPETTPEKGARPAPAGGAFPPADLSMLVTMLATQAMISLGALPNPITKQVERDLPQARHFVDLLEMLEEKTKGNRTSEETQLFDGMLHELRMGCVQAGA